MKKLAMLLFVASIALNVGFLSGCRQFHEVVYGDPCRYAPATPTADDGRAELSRIAGLLDIKTEGKSAVELASDIRSALSSGEVTAPKAMPESAFDEMAKSLSSDEEKIMRAYQRFISTTLRDKKLIVLER